MDLSIFPQMLHPLAKSSSDDINKLLEFYYEMQSKDFLTIETSHCDDGKIHIINYMDAYNKTPPSQWDPRMCIARGLALNETNDGLVSVIWYSLPKFFSSHVQSINIEELGRVDVSPKYDGTCLFVSSNKGNLLTGTRKSLLSIHATKLCYDYITLQDVDVFHHYSGWTFVFELIHPRDKKIQYCRDNGLVILYIVDNHGMIMSNKMISRISVLFSSQITQATVTQMTGPEISKLISKPTKSILDLVEGYVINDGIRRLKLKTKAYIAMSNGILYKDIITIVHSPSIDYFKKMISNANVYPTPLTPFTIKSVYGDTNTSIANACIANAIDELGIQFIESLNGEWGLKIKQLTSSIEETFKRCEHIMDDVMNREDYPCQNVVQWLKKTIGPMKYTIKELHPLMMCHIIKMDIDILSNKEKRLLFYSTDNAIRIAAAKICIKYI